MCGLASRTASASVSATYTMFVMTTSSGLSRARLLGQPPELGERLSCWRIGTNTTE